MAYEIDVLKKQVAALESALNEVRAQAGLTEIQLPKPAKRARVIEDGPLKGAVYMGLRKAP